MDDQYDNARERFYEAIRVLATSADPLQDRLARAFRSIVGVTIDEFEGDAEMRHRFARILDTLSVDCDDLEEAGLDTAAHMTNEQASLAAHLICDFFYDLG